MKCADLSQFTFVENPPETSLLIEDFFYHAIFVSPGNPALPRGIIFRQELLKYHQNWGRNGDRAILAVKGDLTLGMVWCRYFNSSDPGYGFISDDIPELSLSVIPEYRGMGIGSELLRRMLVFCRREEIRRISLSVEQVNPAVRLYHRHGFAVLEKRKNDFVMLLDLS